MDAHGSVRKSRMSAPVASAGAVALTQGRGGELRQQASFLHGPPGKTFEQFQVGPIRRFHSRMTRRFGAGDACIRSGRAPVRASPYVRNGRLVGGWAPSEKRYEFANEGNV